MLQLIISEIVSTFLYPLLPNITSGCTASDKKLSIYTKPWECINVRLLQILHA